MIEAKGLLAADFNLVSKKSPTLGDTRTIKLNQTDGSVPEMMYSNVLDWSLKPRFRSVLPSSSRAWGAGEGQRYDEICITCQVVCVRRKDTA